MHSQHSRRTDLNCRGSSCVRTDRTPNGSERSSIVLREGGVARGVTGLLCDIALLRLPLIHSPLFRRCDSRDASDSAAIANPSTTNSQTSFL